MTLSIALKQLRAELHLKQKELAARLGTNVTTVNRWEKEKNVPKHAMAMLILGFAKENSVSRVCQDNLRDALFPKPDTYDRVNDLRNTEISMINDLVNESSNGVIVIDSDTHEILYANNKIADMEETPIEEVRKQKCYEFLMHAKVPCGFCGNHCASDGRFRDTKYASARTGKSYLIREKQIRWAGKLAQLKYITDTTELEKLQTETENAREKMRLEEKLRDSLKQRNQVLAEKNELEKNQELMYAALFSLVPMVICNDLTNNSYEMLNYDTFTTKKAERGGNYDALIQVGASTVPDDQKESFIQSFDRKNLIQAYNEGKKSVRLEHQQWGDDGILRWIDTNVIFVKSTADDHLYTITLAQNITERKQQSLKLEKALAEAQIATKAKSEFLSRMSHEIRTPMNAILGMTAIAQESKADYKQVEECLDKIDQSSHYLLLLLNDILEMSRIESGRTEIQEGEFDLRDLTEGIQTIVETLALQGDIRYECVNKVDNRYLYWGDRMRVQQILVNILTNAIKFTRAGGRVRFTIAREEQEGDICNLHFTVADTGIGMSEEFMSQMFRPFTQEDGSNTSRYQGSGLGLAISKNLVDLMGGSIHVESFLGVGSTFYIVLPLRYAQKSEHYSIVKCVQKEVVHDEILKGKQILVAEDHPMNILIARKLLENKGAIVTIAENGKEAVDLLNESSPGFYRAILMDIRMPVMDGTEAARRIRQLNRQDARTIPIIAMTANALDEDRKITREAGMNDHLAKPFEPEQLYRTLAAWIK